MKKVTPILVVLAIVGIIVGLFLSLSNVKSMKVIEKGNTSMKPLKMVVDRYQDSDCGMVIAELDYASQVVVPDGRTWFFHDHGGFVHWLSDKPFKDKAKIWVMSRDTKRWIDGKKAYYSVNDETPMGYGFGAYEKNATGRIGYEDMSLKMLRGETLNNPLIRKKIMGK